MGYETPVETTFLFDTTQVNNAYNRLLDNVSSEVEHAHIDRRKRTSDDTRKKAKIRFGDWDDNPYIIRIRTNPEETTDVGNLVVSSMAGEISADNDPDQRTQRLIDIITLIYSLTEPKPKYAYGLDSVQWEESNPLPVTHEDFKKEEFGYVSWLMLFSPSMVERHGREHLLSAPVWQVRELDDGAVMLVAFPDPTLPDEDVYGRLSTHLGISDPREYHRPD